MKNILKFKNLFTTQKFFSKTSTKFNIFNTIKFTNSSRIQKRIGNKYFESILFGGFGIFIVYKTVEAFNYNNEDYLTNSSKIISGDDKEKKLELVNTLLDKMDTRFATWIDFGEAQLKSGFYNAVIKNVGNTNNKNEFILLRILSENNPMIFNETKTKHSKLISTFLLSNFREGYYDSEYGQYESLKSSKERSIYEMLSPKDMDQNLRREVINIKRKFGEKEITNSDVEKIKAIKAFSMNQQTANMMLGTKGFYDALFNISDIEPGITENYIRFANCLSKNQKIAIGFQEEEWNDKITSTFVPITYSNHYSSNCIFYSFVYSALRNSIHFLPAMGLNHFSVRLVGRNVGFSVIGMLSFVGFMTTIKNSNYHPDNYHFSNSTKMISFFAMLSLLYTFAPYTSLPAIYYYFLDIEKSNDELFKNIVDIEKLF
eukprot:TRINITY_DN192_c0_g1_i1.p1 TRINITY_DN192_c0_g1~~TRINITY_DN192_c0_g1_i1.p1  ORF type:complete len:430 (-),score=116.92 TRINITY_DN192_c0_g1_i1:35-1324(-)